MTPEELFRRLERDPDAFARVPVATYRIQLGPEFTFAELGQVIPYLAALGISDCHLSPFLQPTSDRSHGYDVADHGQFNSALGTEADYRDLVETLASHSMGQIMDLVPNHMGIAGSRNAWWTDVLENGRAAACAGFFDIEWDPIKPELKDKVLLPLLGDQYGRLLENQELQLEYGAGAFCTRYHDTVLPLDPCTYVAILEWRLDTLQQTLGAEHPQLLELRSIVTALNHLPPRTEQDSARLEERQQVSSLTCQPLPRLLGAKTQHRTPPASRRSTSDAVRI